MVRDKHWFKKGRLIPFETGWRGMWVLLFPDPRARKWGNTHPQAAPRANLGRPMCGLGAPFFSFFFTSRILHGSQIWRKMFGFQKMFLILKNTNLKERKIQISKNVHEFEYVRGFIKCSWIFKNNIQNVCEL